VSHSELSARVAALGHAGRLTGDDLETVRAATHDPAPTVRAVAVAALVRAAPVRVAAPAWVSATGDPDPAVRRRAAELAPALAARRRGPEPTTTAALVILLVDPDVTVVEAALAAAATGHSDALAREAAVAALGALGDPAGLDAVLAACHDKPAVRRRAVLALAPFTGPAVDAALAAALEDRDWQVRQAAEDLLAAGGDDEADRDG